MAFICGAVVVLADFYKIRLQINAITFISIAQLSLPWSYPLKLIRDDIGELLGIVPAGHI